MLRLIQDESGATALEYGLIGALIAVVISGAVMSLGTQMRGIFSSISTAITTVVN
ncbi:conserved protein of unknown function [Pseudodesulfovibrio profundus]|uniref:Flp/Fap pilin component n=1 Tax=Pseudodesulfovibrio profundus TaxID=57320 RepID=A0A2C8FBB7_9BACT|nr:Flp family type IVb pilin [Pseudodesulfovibrio profundus]MBC15676.1 Flp family type IVb pilin [Desulfovibrio sp.]SOB59739.1 conserved protein of unknown function [Pseudodesulfovibrio profundus]